MFVQKELTQVLKNRSILLVSERDTFHSVSDDIGAYKKLTLSFSQTDTDLQSSVLTEILFRVL